MKNVKKKRVLLTGATGFVGRSIQKRLIADGNYKLTIAIRREVEVPYGARIFKMADLTAETDWSDALQTVDIVIHAAARAHVMKNEELDSLTEYRKVNVEGTLQLARQAIHKGVQRFVFLSSIGVNGNISKTVFAAGDIPNPADLYAQSKYEAEQALWELTKNTDMELVIIRPPLVYGANAPGNFGNLVHWIYKGIPLPLGAIHNKRSLVGLDNLVDLIITCIDHPAAANEVFLAADGRDVSTTELLRAVAKAMGRPSRLLPIPAGLLQLGATVLGKKAMAQRLLGSLQVDISKTQQVLGWQPPFTLEQGLKRCFDDTTV